MRKIMIVLLSQAVLCAGAAVGAAQEGANKPDAATPDVIKDGSRNTSIGRLPAARQGDATDGGGAIVEGSPNVFINGKPAVTTGDRTGCGGIAVGGGGGVFINGKPVARAGDLTTGCPNK
jgi:uncharacterized Zn-binding protein involved in type VI secretion